jgi:uncharacterized protein (TIGR00251 family)
LSPADIRFAVRLTPRSSASRVDGVRDGALRVRVTAPAVDGAANAAMLQLLADELGVARRAVRLVGGATSRQKLVVVDGLDRDAIIACWPDLRV